MDLLSWFFGFPGMLFILPWCSGRACESSPPRKRPGDILAFFFLLFMGFHPGRRQLYSWTGNTTGNCKGRIITWLINPGGFSDVAVCHLTIESRSLERDTWFIEFNDNWIFPSVLHPQYFDRIMGLGIFILLNNQHLTCCKWKWSSVYHTDKNASPNKNRKERTSLQFFFIKLIICCWAWPDVLRCLCFTNCFKIKHTWHSFESH